MKPSASASGRIFRTPSSPHDGRMFPGSGIVLLLRRRRFLKKQDLKQLRSISERRVQKLCEENRIPGVAKFSRMWLIPKDAEKPVDGRRKSLVDKEE